MPRQFKSTDTSQWVEQFGTGKNGSLTVSSTGGTFRANISGYTTNAPAYGEFTGTSGNTTGTAIDANPFLEFNSTYVAVGDFVVIHQSFGTNAGAWELNVVTGGLGTGTQNITLKYPLQNTYTTGAQIVKAPQFTDFTINNSVILYIQEMTSSFGGLLPIFCNGTVTINGTLGGEGRGFYRGNTTGGTGNQGGSSTAINGSASTSANGAGGGGGGIGDGAAAGGGGGGGNGTAGATGGPGARTPGTGGSTDGTTDLTDFNIGAGGGAGGFRTGGSGGPGAGGYGGAGIMIFTKNLVVNGSITAQGGVGQVKSGSASHGCGGGGAGGSILIKAITATLGTNLVTASGGLGGVVGGGNDGGNGGVGRIHLDYASSYTGTTTPTLDVTQDSSLYPAGGAFIYNLL
jgi:hypothetical protein